MLKAEGVTADIPNLMLPVLTASRAGLWLELKRRGCRPSPEQIERLTSLEQNGYGTALIYGWQAARKEILNYLGAAR